MKSWNELSEYEDVRSSIATSTKFLQGKLGLVVKTTWWISFMFAVLVEVMARNNERPGILILTLIFFAYAGRQARVNRVLLNEIERMKVQR